MGHTRVPGRGYARRRPRAHRLITAAAVRQRRGMSFAARPDPERTGTDLCWFAILTLLISWGPLAVAIIQGSASGPWFILGTSGPTLAALLLWLAGRRRPRGPGRAVVSRVWMWAPAAVVLGVLPSVVAAVLTPALGGPPFDPSVPGRIVGETGGLLAVSVMVLLAGPLAEEFGWRGYAQPRLQRRFGPIATSVVLGVGWSLWHLPLFFVEGTSQFAMGIGSLAATLFLVAFVPLTYLFWFVSARLGGGVASAVLMHAALNAGFTFLGISSAAALAVVLVTATAAALIIGTRERMLATARRHAIRS